jgi:intracellular septation protein
MKMLLDFTPALLFFGAYYFFGIYVATATLIVSLFLLVAVYWLMERRVHRTHLVTALVAGVLGGLTLALHDATFIMYKPTVVYALFSLALLVSQFVGDRVLMQRIPQKVIVLPDPVWRKVNLAWVLFFAVCAVLNLYVASHFDEATWVKFKAFGFPVLMFLFLIAHAPFLSKYLPDET